MSKKAQWVESRVIVTPRAFGNFGGIHVGDSLVSKNIERDYKARCDEIISDIRRHTDNVGYIERDDVTEDVCEHCGDRWTEDSPTYNGGCCSQDQEAEDAKVPL